MCQHQNCERKSKNQFLLHYYYIMYCILQVTLDVTIHVHTDVCSLSNFVFCLSVMRVGQLYCWKFPTNCTRDGTVLFSSQASPIWNNVIEYGRLYFLPVLTYSISLLSCLLTTTTTTSFSLLWPLYVVCTHQELIYSPQQSQLSITMHYSVSIQSIHSH
jgi:hypothetical protein